MARAVGVNAVGLVEAPDRGDALEQEGHERDVPPPGQVAEHAREGPSVRLAVVRRKAHPREEDTGAGGTAPPDDLIEVLPHRGHALPPQAVVGPEGDDDDLRPGAEHPVHPAQRAGAGVSADSRVDDAIPVPLAPQALLDPGGERLLGSDTESGRQAVSERHDDALALTWRRTLAPGATIDLAAVGCVRPGQRERTDEQGQAEHGHGASVVCTVMMIRVRDLVMRLASGGHPVTILDGISLDVPRGEFLAVTGPSGSGKSTLLGLIAGLDQPTRGSIVVDGVEITALGEDALARVRREKIGFVFQSYHLIPTLTAAENVAVPMELGGLAGIPTRAGELLDAVGLAGRGHHYPAQLSGGEQQRVALARAVALHPALLLADEPTGNLDSATGAQIIDLLLGLRRESGSTLVLVTHDPALAHHADRVVMLRDGRVTGERRPARSVSA